MTVLTRLLVVISCGGLLAVVGFRFDGWVGSPRSQEATTLVPVVIPPPHTHIVVETPQAVVGNPYWPLRPGKFEVTFIWRNGDQAEANVLQDGMAMKIVHGFRGVPSDEQFVKRLFNGKGLWIHSGSSHYVMNPGEIHNTILWRNNLTF
jgi:hypothetical protein